jgi:hypothetical protein
MAIRGRDRYDNLSAMGAPKEGPPVRFGEYVVPSAVSWTTEPIGRDPIARAEFELRRGVPVCTAVTITATPGGRPVVTADLATLPGLDRKAADAFRALAIGFVGDVDAQGWPKVDRRPKGSAVSAAIRQGSDDELRQVAEVYKQNFDRAPVEAVEEWLDSVTPGGVSRRTADRRIALARKRGFLPETSRGRKRRD